MASFKDILLEIKKTEIINKTDDGRINRAIKQLRLNPPQVIGLENDLERLQYNFKFKPSTEFKRHWGFVEYDSKTKNIIRVWCDCKDFGYRLWAPYVKAGLADWENDLPKRYKKRPTFKHNHSWTDETNPLGILYGCKHIIALLRGYF